MTTSTEFSPTEQGFIRRDLLHFTEIQLATLEDVAMRKRTSKSELERHTAIAALMLSRCVAYRLHDAAEGRVEDLMKRFLAADPSGEVPLSQKAAPMMRTVVEAWVSEIRS